MLWARMPADLAAKCPLLPGPCRDPTMAPAGPAAADFFQPHYLEAILPALQATSASHPRLHSLWDPLLSLLLPGFQVLMPPYTLLNFLLTLRSFREIRQAR